MTIPGGCDAPGGQGLSGAHGAAWRTAAVPHKMLRSFTSDEPQSCWGGESWGLTAKGGGCGCGALKTFHLFSSGKWLLSASQVELPTPGHPSGCKLAVPQFSICSRIIPLSCRAALRQINVCKPLGYCDNKCCESPGEN